ncbi:hypothetical protein FKP32DRAFT_84785 [Trametes sanguinea]|nr:hypothetical protein FKP32DRAFT_84785 [Trametes sanguinea]
MSPSSSQLLAIRCSRRPHGGCRIICYIWILANWLSSRTHTSIAPQHWPAVTICPPLYSTRQPHVAVGVFSLCDVVARPPLPSNTKGYHRFGPVYTVHHNQSIAHIHRAATHWHSPARTMCLDHRKARVGEPEVVAMVHETALSDLLRCREVAMYLRSRCWRFRAILYARRAATCVCYACRCISLRLSLCRCSVPATDSVYQYVSLLTLRLVVIRHRDVPKAASLHKHVNIRIRGAMRVRHWLVARTTRHDSREWLTFCGCARQHLTGQSSVNGTPQTSANGTLGHGLPFADEDSYHAEGSSFN